MVPEKTSLGSTAAITTLYYSDQVYGISNSAVQNLNT